MQTWYDFKDILIMPEQQTTITSRRNVHITDGTIAAANMEGVGTFDMAREISVKGNAYTFIDKHYTLDEWKAFIDSFFEDQYQHIEAEYETNKVTGATRITGASVNLSRVVFTMGLDFAAVDTYIDIIAYMKNRGLGAYHKLDKICVDVANGHMEDVIQMTQYIRKKTSAKIIVGNFANPAVLDNFLEAGVLPYAIKIGIGSGSVCSTRTKTGIGVPQASLISMFVQKIKSMNMHNRIRIISDGGCRTSGDILKALALGADTVMLGGMLAFTNQSEQQGVLTPTGLHHIFKGSSHTESKSFGGDRDYATSEGLEVSRPIVGDVNEIISDIYGGIRSGCSYLDCNSTSSLSKKGRDGDFIMGLVNRQTDNYS